MKSYKGLMENIPYPGHKCSDGTNIFRRLRTSGRQTSCEKTFNLKTGQRGKSEVSCEVRSSIGIENDQQ